jgi:hypothetical protein
MYRIHNRCRTVKNKFLLGKYKSTRWRNTHWSI